MLSYNIIINILFYGFLWFFMVFYGFLWFFMVFYGINEEFDIEQNIINYINFFFKIDLFNINI